MESNIVATDRRIAEVKEGACRIARSAALVCNDTQRSAVASVNTVGSAAEIRSLSPESDGVAADGWLAEAVELLARVA